MANYNEPIILELNQPVEFPDFTVEFVGERQEPTQPWGKDQIDHFTYHDYKISHSGKEHTVSFTSGTGLLSPRKFEIGGKTFSLMGYASNFQVVEGYDPTGAAFSHKKTEPNTEDILS